MVKETRADRLRKRRIELGYPDAATAARARGWVVRTYQAHEAGTKPIGRKNLERYAASYGISLDWLMTGKTHSTKILSDVPQPPLAFRYIPLLSLMDLRGAKNKMELLAIEPTTKTLVNVQNDLGEEVRAFHAPDNSMMETPFNPDTNIRAGEEIIVDAKADPKPGEAVAAVLLNPPRFVVRQFGLVRRNGSGGPHIVRLTALSPHFPEELIASEDDGYVIGPVVRVQTVRNFRR